ncbi:MAG: hypothetical protein LBI19_01225 [Oscillospiraceae bacterium]|jgi:hypothetical protein|nr:hypothetical protein [Oscillospiraceae bacterium]
MWEIWLAASVAALIIVLILHERSVRRRFKEAQAETRENRALDQKIVRLYREIEEMLDSFEAYVGEVHEELESRRNELLTMSRQATTLYMQVMQPGVFAPKPQVEEAPPPGEPPAPLDKPAKKEPRPSKKGETPAEEGKPSRLSQRDRAELDRLPGKGQKIRYLTGKGLTMSEVARELNIGKGEIRLILDLDKD